MKFTTQDEIKRLITKLPNKTSCGHDKISNSLLKSLVNSIAYPLCNIFNQIYFGGNLSRPDEVSRSNSVI